MMQVRAHTTQSPSGDARLRLGLFIGLLLLLFISQLPVLRELLSVWLHDPDAGHGLLVPWLALYLAWQRRSAILEAVGLPSTVGLLALALAMAARVAGIWWGLPYLDRAAVIIAIWGLCATIFGWRAALLATAPIAFLLLALPLPGRFQTVLAGPLQSFATRATEYLLVVSGVTLTRAGNVIIVQDYEIAVAEACNGLRMLLAYAMICVFFALAIRKVWWERVLMVLAIVPVALAANVIRIYLTALMVISVGEETASDFFHDMAGYVLMPLAVLMLVVWLWMIRRSFPVDRLATEAGQLDAASTVALERKTK